jgi:selenocysteine lyase/cysteine desulfurase
LNFKRLFARSLSADPHRLHMAAHSHYLWPDASFDGHVESWLDAARYADRKWDRIMGEVWPEAQRQVASELGTDMPDAIVFAPNTHELLVRIAAAAPRPADSPLRVLTSDGEFHSARRQFARWAESGEITLEQIALEPFDSFAERFLERARSGDQDFIFVSQVFFGSGRIFDRVEEVAQLGRPEGPWVVIDGYHAFMAIPLPLAGGEEARSAEGAGMSETPPPRRPAAESAFYLAGGYKYAMAGEGCAFAHAPPGFGPRPPITGWYAEFEDLTLPPGTAGYAKDARRFMGATFDASGLYRFTAVQRMLEQNELTTARVSAHVAELQAKLLELLRSTAFASAELLNPLDGAPHARFLAFRTPDAKSWCSTLAEANCIVDVRGDVLRIGLGLYHDQSDVERFARLAAGLRA